MSLIHWWPLNGNLNDYGVLNSSITVTNQPSTQYISGKIGQCYNFDGNVWGQVSNVSVGTDCTICCWAKTSTTSSSMLWGMQCTGSDYMNFYNSWRVCLNVGDSEDNPFKDADDNDIPQIHDGLWHHLVVVFKGNEKAKLYIDGEYAGQAVTYRNPTMSNQNFTLGTWNYSSHGYYWNGGICDVRIYDHALSQKEVKEISKCLVLHYNFEDGYIEGTTNLINQSTPITHTVRCSTYGNGVKIDWTDPNNQGDTYFMFNTPNMTEGVTYTLSFDCSGLLADSDTTWAVSNTYAPAKLHNGRNVFTFTPTSSALQLFFDDWSRDIRLTQLVMTNFQLEQKDHATPFVNGTRQPGLVYDNSGYGYNGTQVDCSIVQPSDNKSGKSSLLTNTSGYVQLPSIYLDTSFTLSTWCKHLDSFSAWARIFDFGNATSGQDYDIGFATSDSYGTTYVFGRTGGGASLPDVGVDAMDFNWHLWSLVVNGTNIKLYKDGALKYEFTAYGNVGGVLYTLNYLNKSNWAGDGVSNKYYADFKIFNTALSADDILAEYNKKASIDKSGNLFTQYINENETTTNLMEKINFNIEQVTNFRAWAYLAHCTEDTYNANWPNNSDVGLSAYVQDNCQVTATSQGIRIYSTPNATSDSTWGGLTLSPMVSSRCLIKGHHYRISWHIKGKSSRQMTDVYWTNNVGWGQYPDANPTVHKAVLPPANFDGEMDCLYDFTIEDDIFQTTTSDVHSGFEPNTSYLAYASFKIGFTYQETGEMGTDVYITDVKMYDLTTGEVYKIEKNGIVKTTELVSGRRDSARLHSDGVIDITDIVEC